MDDLLTALALVLVIEGCLWALFPDGMRRAMAQALAMPAATLRIDLVRPTQLFRMSAIPES